MKSVGEAMAIGRSFAESVQKALRSMETGLTGFDEVAIEGVESAGKEAVKAALAKPVPDRLLLIAQAYRYGLTTQEIHAACRFEPWFLEQIREIVNVEERMRREGLPPDRTKFLRLKQMGFSDARLGRLAGLEEEVVRGHRHGLDLHPVYKRIDTCAAEFPSQTSYMYSCYEGDGFSMPECEADPSDRRKVIILGGGPNRIGQGIEFDYCCVHAAYSLRDAGVETIMVNCNPETVSTDYDTSDRLYFEPLTTEDVVEIVWVEEQRGTLLGVIVQFGGQTPLKLASALERSEIPILGTSPDAIDLAEDRQRFQGLLSRLGLRQPHNGTAYSASEAEAVALDIGYPVVIRPSYVLGGRAMEIVHDTAGLHRYISHAVSVSGTSPVLIDRYLQNAIEVDVDAVSDGRLVDVAGIMEHIEEAGIHSGDSACSLPPYNLSREMIAEIERQTVELARALGVVGLMNVQFAVQDGVIFVLEVNPRASRTVPFVAKATGVPIAKIAAQLMAGEPLDSWRKHIADKRLRARGHVAVKEAVFPFARFPGVDPILSPEMKSTGEVMGLDSDFGRAFAKSQLASGTNLPVAGCVFVSVRDQDKGVLIEPCSRLVDMKFSLLATKGTAQSLSAAGLPVISVNKVREGRPHVVDRMLSGAVQLVFNTTEGVQAIADSFSLRRTALTNGIPYYTTVAGARAAVQAIAALRAGNLEVAPLQSYL
jgi:carbamoyl-phosphate synthase large subunit